MKRLAALAVLAALALGPIVVAWIVQERRAAQDVVGSSTEEFVETAEPEPPPPPPKPPPPKPGKPAGPPPETADGEVWPTYGYGPERARISPYAHRPPFARRWTFRGRTLLEFPPSLAYGRLYVTNGAGFTFAVDTRTGKVVWRHASGRCVASTPAVAGGLVYQSFLSPLPCQSKQDPDEIEGLVIAFDARTGKIAWRTRLGPTESPPLVAGNRVYVGDWRGRVYALGARTGNVVWSTQLGGRVKSGLALTGGRLVTGAYDGNVYGLDASTGEILWRSGAQSSFGRSGNFYATPALAYGRVYVGNTDGKVYAFGATTGALLWSRSTGGYVYGAPAVWRKRVFTGSYSGRFYALDAATGATLWSFRANGPVMGAPTVMDGLVWFSTLRERTYALDARTGEVVWEWPDGKYTPIVADSRRVYLVGEGRVYALDPR